MAINVCLFTGRLTAAPELKTTQSGISVCSAVLAVDRSYGEKKETDFIPLRFWRGIAETVVKYCDKGSKITVTGSLRVRRYEDKDGKKRTAYEVVVDDMELPQKLKEQRAEQAVAVEPPPIIDSDDLPF